LLNGRTLPLRPRIANQANRNFAVIQYQPIEHEREVDIGDRPAVEKVFATMAEQFAGGIAELSDADCAAEGSGAETGCRWKMVRVGRSLWIGMKSLRSQA
jgi:hypothetical protein